MRTKRMTATQVREQADALDTRRRNQISNQITTINRLLDDPSASDEIVRLHEQLAEAQAALEEATVALAEASAVVAGEIRKEMGR